MQETSISKIYWLWIPIIVMGIQILLETFLSYATLSALHSENGLYEIVQAFIMITAFFVSLYCLLNSKISKTLLLKFWFGLATLCCLYVAGEEISWGQHVLGWTTPEEWQNLNDQGETNLHNTSSWLDQKPRLILILSILFGSFIAPFILKKKWLTLPENLQALLPPPELRVIAFLIIAPQLAEKIFEVFNITIFTRFSEVQELYIFYYVLLYLIVLRRKFSILHKN